ncbi:hypothetical protein PRIPAC_87886 [Pristionchus pacificus]|uniref:alanine--tRNA ligase n=1 Tax=Pristionchus pacificus TaxID=54126 RepID=A0A2A6CTA5_PRIPA|nr:hypothetical protein PRIPAC_87886 [Pristionchus pacificus]|eukprot:PDM81415.1 tRNA synthetase [Pristionchus pacificus]
MIAKVLSIQGNLIMLVTRVIRRHASSIRSGDETRRAFVNFFESEGHVQVPSSSVVPPASDQSLLFTNAGMNQFKGVLAGVESADRWPSRVVTHQKCIRAGGKHNDLDDVGKDLHHLSFFEMMGNWAFNNAYGKETACKLAWTFLTEVIQIPKDRLYVTYFGGNARWGVAEDTETRDIWRTMGLDPSRILPFVGENFWEMGRTGSCGPCTEIHYDRVEGRSGVPHLVNRDDSVVELWNVVFTNSMRHEDGSVSPLDTMHVDTGLGLERLVSVVQGVGSNFDTDLFRPIIGGIEKLSASGARYAGRVGAADAPGVDAAFRLVADHVRAASVALTDGARPSGADAGFVVRKMIRRAAWRATSQLAAPRHSLAALVPVVVGSLESAYPELRKEKELIEKMIENEEKKEIHNEGLKPGDTVSGATLFRLHDARGLSPDLVELLADARGLRLDLEGYDRLRIAAKEQSKAADEKKKGVRR